MTTQRRTSQSLPTVSRMVTRTQVAARSLRTGGNVTQREFVLRCMGYEQELFAAAMKLARNPDAAKDLVQDTMLRAMVGWQSFAQDTNLRAWLYRILTNGFINGYRKRRRHERLTHERPLDARTALYGDSEDSVPNPVTEAARTALGDEVSAALDSLDADYRFVVEHADLRGEKYRDIADQLGVPIGTVMSRLFRARRTLQAQLADYAETDYGLTAA